MAYDFIFAKNIQEAAKKNPDLTMEDELHDAFLSAINAYTDKSWIINRSTDYYGDSQYDNSELPRLTQELEMIEGKISNLKIKELFKEFKSICKTEMDRGSNLYGVSD